MILLCIKFIIRNYPFVCLSKKILDKQIVCIWSGIWILCNKTPKQIASEITTTIYLYFVLYKFPWVILLVHVWYYTFEGTTKTGGKLNS